MPDSPVRPSFQRPHAGFLAQRTLWQDQDLHQPVGVDATRLSRNGAAEGGQRHDRAHADAERDDADQREGPLLGERAHGMHQIAPE